MCLTGHNQDALVILPGAVRIGRRAITALNSQEELHQEQGGDHIGQDGNILCLAAEDLHDGVADQADADGMADGAGDRHTDEHQRHGHHLVHVVEIHLLQALEHQNAHIDQGCGGSGSGNDGGDGCDEHAGQEQHASDQRRQTGAAASLHAGSGFHEGGNSGGAGAGAYDGADGIRQQGFLHVGHVAFLIHHTGTGSSAHQGADGIEHIDDAEGDDQGHHGEPADLSQAGKVELEEGGIHHILNRRHEGGSSQRGEGVGVQEYEGADPVHHRGNEHAEQNGTLDALLGHSNDGKQANEHGNDGEDHGSVAGITHVGLQDAGGQGTEKVPHHIEGSGKAVALGIDAHIGAQANVHQHQADGRRDTQTDAQRNGLHDLLTNIENRQHDEHDAFHQDDHQRGLEGSHIAHAGQGHDVAHDHSKEAVQAHAGRHGKGLVGQECHAEHTDGGGHTGGYEHAVPQGAAGVKIRQQVGVQRDDIGHGHERGQTGHHFRLHGGAVFLQLEGLFKHSNRTFLPLFPGIPGIYVHCTTSSGDYNWRKKPNL